MTTHVTSTWTTFSTRTAWCTALENKLYPFHVRTVQLVQGKGQTSLSTVFSVGAKQGCVFSTEDSAAQPKVIAHVPPNEQYISQFLCRGET
jgi:hypothetical protein